VSIIIIIIIIIMLPNQAIASTPSAPRPSGAEGSEQDTANRAISHLIKSEHAVCRMQLTCAELLLAAHQLLSGFVDTHQSAVLAVHGGACCTQRQDLASVAHTGWRAFLANIMPQFTSLWLRLWLPLLVSNTT
jgi:hypothetical protein